MTIVDHKTLLALLLTLSDLETSLNQQEKFNLNDIARQLFFKPDKWELIEPKLLNIIEENSHLNQLFQAYQSRLEYLAGDLLSNLLPTEAELEKVVPWYDTGIRGARPVPSSSEAKNNEIVNIAIRVMVTPDPAETSKKIGLEQLKQSLVQPSH